ncbi:MAG: phospho-sugar mutase, partial [Oscillospiraceae bacterium]|nr:phospho-sugar mutase [Oscillospiraceae bacterium]
FEGEDGMNTMNALMRSLREEPPAVFAGYQVVDRIDYLHDRTGLIPADVLEFRLEDDAKLIVRPSGTEPKLKLYLSVRGRSAFGANQTVSDLTAGAKVQFSMRSGL